MTFTGFLLMVLVVWLVCGVAASLVLGRRGHDPYPWALMGAALGPLVVPLVLQARKGERMEELVVGRGLDGSGPVDVVAGIDGSTTSTLAVDRAVQLLGPRIGRLELVSVLTFGGLTTASIGADHDRRDHATAQLAKAAAQAEATIGRTVGQTLLTGDPAHALDDHARSGGYDLVVLGNRGSGATTALLGSVALELAGSSSTPLLIVPAAVPR